MCNFESLTFCFFKKLIKAEKDMEKSRDFMKKKEGSTVGAKHGDTVKVHYACFLDDGSLVETTLHSKPLQFIIGKGHVIHGFEEAVLGMNVDESKTIKIAMDKAFGPRKDENILVIQREQFSEPIDLEIGQELQMPIMMNGRKMVATVIDVAESAVTFDINHPLSGKNLTFNIRLLEID
jgi:peptidylprolyl isomerase